MDSCAICADKSAKSHVAMRAPVVLAVDAVCVELLLVDSFTKVSAYLSTLNVTL